MFKLNLCDNTVKRAKFITLFPFHRRRSYLYSTEGRKSILPSGQAVMPFPLINVKLNNQIIRFRINGCFAVGYDHHF